MEFPNWYGCKTQYTYASCCVVTNKNKLNISFVAQKKLGNAVKRNKIKRRLRNIMNQIIKIYKINLNYSYLLIAKKEIINANFSDIKKTIFKDYKKIK